MIVLGLLALVFADLVMHWRAKVDRIAFTPPSHDFVPTQSSVLLLNGRSRLIDRFSISLNGGFSNDPQSLINELFGQVLSDVSSDLNKTGSPEVSLSNNGPFYTYKAFWPNNQGFLFMNFLVSSGELEAISYFGMGESFPQDDQYFQALSVKIFSGD